MGWEKFGLIFDIRVHDIPWLKSHALMPTPMLLKNKIRIFYTGRDLNGQSRINTYRFCFGNKGEKFYTFMTNLCLI